MEETGKGPGRMVEGEAVVRDTTPYFRWGGVLLLIGVIVLGIVTGPSVLDGLRRWQADNVLSQAEELARQQMFAEAIERLELALQLDPRSANALRLLATMYTRYDLPYALAIWRSLLSLPERTDADVHRYIELALRLNRFDLAGAELGRLLSDPNISIETRLQAEEFFIRQGEPGRALPYAQQLLEQDPTNRVYQLGLARILLHLPAPEQRQNGLQLVRRMRDLSPDELRTLLRILIDVGTSPGDDLKAFIATLPLPSAASSDDFFLLADARLKLQSDQKEAIIQGAVEKYRHASVVERAALGSWLNRIGASERVPEVIRRQDLFSSAPLAMAYLEAMARLREWKSLQEATDIQLPLEAWLIAGLKAAAAQHLDQEAVARDQWRRAFEDVRGSPGKLRALGELALRLDAPDRAIQAFSRLTADRLSSPAAFRLLAGVYEKTRDVQRLRIILREWSLQVPDDPAPDNAFCYLSALLNEDVEGAYQRARNLQERLPGRINYRSTLALLELRRGRPQAALRLYDHSRLVPTELPSQARLVYAAVLAANGRASEARTLVSDMDGEKLLPAEHQILMKIQTSEEEKDGGHGG